MSDDKRRKAIKALAVGAPAAWVKPIVDFTLLPAHANMSVSLGVTCDPLPESVLPLGADSNETLTATLNIFPNPGADQEVKVSYLCNDSLASIDPQETVMTDASGSVSVSVNSEEKNCPGQASFTIQFEYGDMQTSCTWAISCFLLGTGVLMYDGSLRFIEDVREGDLIKGLDWKRGEVVNQRVVSTKSGISRSIMKVNNLGLTSGHALSSLNSGWIQARDLRTDTTLTGLKGVVKARNINEYRKTSAVHSIDVSKTRNFFVSDGHDHFLAHV